MYSHGFIVVCSDVSAKKTVTGAYLASDPHAAKELGEQRRRSPRTVLPFSFIVKRDFYLLRHYPAVV